MRLIETHCHSKGGSYCAKSTNQEILEDLISAGYGGVVLTNHYAKGVSKSTYAGLSDKERVDSFFALYDSLKEEGDKVDFRVFYGVEVRISCTGTEYMLVGFDRKFLYDNPVLYELNQEELFNLCEKEGVFMYQTHPFREGVLTGDPRFMHGAEAFNGHFHHVNRNSLAQKFVAENGLINMAGTDYHDKNQPLTTGCFIPEDILDNKTLADYFKSGKADFITKPDYYVLKLKEYKASIGVSCDTSFEE